MKINFELEVDNIVDIKNFLNSIIKYLPEIEPQIQKIEQGVKKFSEVALQLLASPYLEATKLKWYYDSNGYKTIGVGHLLTQSELSSGKITIGTEIILWSNGLTQTQAEKLLLQDLKRFEVCINDHVKVELTQNQYDALVIFCFNIGTGAFEGSTCLKLLNEKQYDQVPVQMRRWNKTYDENHNLVVSQGLVNRREKEIKIWEGSYDQI